LKTQYWVHSESEISHTFVGVDYDLDTAETAHGAWYELARIAEKGALTDEEIGQLVRELLRVGPQGVNAFYR